MIGVSLPLKWFIIEEETPENFEEILTSLKNKGVKSIELRAYVPSHTPLQLKKAVDIVHDHGFLVTVHAMGHALDTVVEDVFAPLELVLQSLQQEQLMITLHPIVGDNAQMMRKLSDYAIEKEYPVMLALENNRLMPDNTLGDSMELVYHAVKEVNRENVGICFDMGHFTYYTKRCQETNPDFVPRDDFWEYVVHTHIHALNGLTTHHPLGPYELPLQAYVEKFSRRYYGVYNIELTFQRFAEEWEPLPALEISVSYLSENLPHHAKLIDRTREEYDDKFRLALTCLEGAPKGTRFSLMRSACYLFNTNGFRWGMDLSFLYTYRLCKLPNEATHLLKDLELILITHEHADHLEEQTVRVLSGNGTRWVIPDFLVEKALSYGLSRQKIIVAKPNETINYGPLTILPFVSKHFRPGTTSGVPEYGYYVTATDAPSMVFPGDIRDYAILQHPFPKADYCFAHLWLGDDNTVVEESDKYLEPFARYMLDFSDKNIFIGHLYEKREDSKMWRIEHAQKAIDTISRISPETRVCAPSWGDVFEL